MSTAEEGEFSQSADGVLSTDPSDLGRIIEASKIAGDLGRIALEFATKLSRTNAPDLEQVSVPLRTFDFGQLTKRELDMMVALSEGLSNSEIAGRQFVTEQTVKFHLSNIYKKLGVANRTEAVRVFLDQSKKDNNLSNRSYMSEERSLAVKLAGDFYRGAGALLDIAAAMMGPEKDEPGTVVDLRPVTEPATLPSEQIEGPFVQQRAKRGETIKKAVDFFESRLGEKLGYIEIGEAVYGRGIVSDSVLKSRVSSMYYQGYLTRALREKGIELVKERVGQNGHSNARATLMAVEIKEDFNDATVDQGEPTLGFENDGLEPLSASDQVVEEDIANQSGEVISRNHLERKLAVSQATEAWQEPFQRKFKEIVHRVGSLHLNEQSTARITQVLESNGFKEARSGARALTAQEVALALLLMQDSTNRLLTSAHTADKAKAIIGFS